MKTKLLFTLLATFFFGAGIFNSFAQQRIMNDEFIFKTPKQKIRFSSLEVIYDSIYHYSWDTLTSNWKDRFKEIDIVYNATKKITSKTGFNWNGSAWEKSALYSYVYDSNNNLVSKLEQSRQNNTWVNSWRYISEFDSNNNEISVLIQSWENNTWVNSFRFFSHYDISNNYLGDMGQKWDGVAWVNSDSVLYIYDANNNWTSMLSLSWNGTSWSNGGLHNATIYNAQNKLLSYNYHVWNGSSWVLSGKYSYTYDASGNNTQIQQEEVDGVNWTLASDRTSVFDANNIVTDHFEKVFMKNKVIYGSGVHYYFHTHPSGTDDWNGTKENILVYPNPSNSGIFTIRQGNATVEIKIYDLIGKQIYSAAITNQETVIDLSKQAKGIYFIQLSSKSKITRARKLVID